MESHRHLIRRMWSSVAMVGPDVILLILISYKYNFSSILTFILKIVAKVATYLRSWS